MSKLTKAELVKMTNEEIAERLDMDLEKVNLAFKNYNILMKFIEEMDTSIEDKVAFFLKVTEDPARSDFGEIRGKEAIELGILNTGIAQIALTKRASITLVESLIETMQGFKLEDFIKENAEEGALDEVLEQEEKDTNDLLSNVQLDQLEIDTADPQVLISLYTGIIQKNTSALTLTSFDKEGNFSGDKKGLLEKGKAIQDAIKKLKEQFDKLKNGTGSKGDDSTPPKTPPNKDEDIKPGTESTPEKIPTNIEDDIYGQQFESSSEDEDLFSIWLDRVMIYKLGKFDDFFSKADVYWTSKVEAFIKDKKDKRKIINSFAASKIYEMEDREELRLAPDKPNTGKRAFPVSKDHWRQTSNIESEDAFMAIRSQGNQRSFPLSRLIKLKIDFVLYESEKVEKLTAALAALSSAGINLFALTKGKTITEEQLKTARKAIKIALDAINELIFGESKMLFGTLKFTPAILKKIVATGENFKLDESTTAHYGTENLRIASGLLEEKSVEGRENPSVIGKDEIDEYLNDPKRTKELKEDPKDFLNSKFQYLFQVLFRVEVESGKNKKK